jgi:hypothetical protein
LPESGASGAESEGGCGCRQRETRKSKAVDVALGNREEGGGNEFKQAKRGRRDSFFLPLDGHAHFRWPSQLADAIGHASYSHCWVRRYVLGQAWLDKSIMPCARHNHLFMMQCRSGVFHSKRLHPVGKPHLFWLDCNAPRRRLEPASKPEVSSYSDQFGAAIICWQFELGTGRWARRVRIRFAWGIWQLKNAMPLEPAESKI